MSTPDPEGMSMLAKVLGAGVAVVGAFVVPVIKVRHWLDEKMEKKADKEDFDKFMERTQEHLERLYSNAEADRKLTRDLHDQAMIGIMEGQKQIISILEKRP